MQLFSAWLVALLSVALCLSAQAPTPEAKEAQTIESKGIPPRSAPGDYQSQAPAGSLTIAADFTGHSVPKPDGPLATEDYVVVEAAFFGLAGTRIQLNHDDFSLRINGKKTPLSSTPFGLVARSLKDPAYVAPEEAEGKQKSKSGLSTGGGQDNSSLPVIIHIPIELRRAMALYVQKSALPEGDRAVPVDGLLFFPYRGKAEGIHSMELIYSGAAGKATLNLQP